MKRILRLAWVLAANSFLAFVFFQNEGRGFVFDGQWHDPDVWFDMIFAVSVPIAGIILELANARYAKWVNIAAFAIPACYFSAKAIHWLYDSLFFPFFLFIALILFVCAAATAIVYRVTRSKDSAVGYS
jgi:hypothetical protein